MKIAIPTNDGLTITPDFGKAKGFLILTVELGEITREEMRWNSLNPSDEFLAPINDCGAFIVNDIDPVFHGILSARQKEVIRTRELFITNAYVHFLENRLHKEANTCCCP